MIYTVKIYYKDALIYVLSNTSGDPSVHDVIRRTIRETLRSWREHYPAVVKDFEVQVGYLTEIRSEFPGDNGGGQMVGGHDLMIVAVLQSIIGNMASALDEMNKGEETGGAVSASNDDLDGWIKRHEENPHGGDFEVREHLYMD